MYKLHERVALVSGAGRGIGQAIAIKLASEGASVVVNDLDAGPANETVDAIRSAGGQAVACVGSITEADFADEYVGSALDTFGRWDIIVNNAGYTWDGVIQRMTDEQWYAMVDVHLTGPFRVLRSALPYLRTATGREVEAGARVVRKVVNISSISGLHGNSGQVGYGAAKAGVVGLTKTLAKEWGRYQVTVNSVAFGLIKTRLTAAPVGERSAIRIGQRDIKVGIGADLTQAMEQRIPMGRAGTPQDAANGVYLFCAPESDYITGEVVICGGGLTL